MINVMTFFSLFPVIDLVNMDSSVSEIEFNNRQVTLSIHPPSKSYTNLNNVCAESFGSSIGGPVSRPTADMSTADSLTTHTSDFISPSTSDGDQLLERLNDMPDTLDKALTINQSLQRRLVLNIERLEESLRHNLRRQVRTLRG